MSLTYPRTRTLARDAGRSVHHWRNPMRAPAGALPDIKFAVAGRRATFARLQAVGVHRQTHRTTRLTPLETGGEKDLVQAFGLSLRFHQTGARHRSEEHTSELQSLMRSSYAVFCLKKKTQNMSKRTKIQINY